MEYGVRGAKCKVQSAKCKVQSAKRAMGAKTKVSKDKGHYLVLCILFWLVQSSMGGWRYMIWLKILMSCICLLICGFPPGLWAGVTGSVSLPLLSSVSSSPTSTRVKALGGRHINSCQEDKRTGDTR